MRFRFEWRGQSTYRATGGDRRRCRSSPGVDPIEMDLHEWVGQLEEALEDNSDRLDGILKILKKRTKYECSSSDEEPETTKIEVHGRSKTKQNREASPSPDYSSGESTCSKSPSRKKKDPAKKYLRKKFLEGEDKVKTGDDLFPVSTPLLLKRLFIAANPCTTAKVLNSCWTCSAPKLLISSL